MPGCSRDFGKGVVALRARPHTTRFADAGGPNKSLRFYAGELRSAEALR